LLLERHRSQVEHRPSLPAEHRPSLPAEHRPSLLLLFHRSQAERRRLP
jgi:hypothetical protein